MKIQNTLRLLVALFSVSTPWAAQAQHGTKATFEDLNGIVAAFRCSGLLVSLGQDDSEPGTMLSAGHCSSKEVDVNYLPYTARVNQSLATAEESASYYQLQNNTITLGNFPLRAIVYGTMTYEDVTLFSTVPTLGELKKMGVKIYQISDRLPAVGQKVKITSGLWGQTQLCSVERVLANNAAEKTTIGTSPSPLEMRNTLLMNSECTARAGWSGSPLIDPVTGMIYGVASRTVTPTQGGNTRVLASTLVEFKKCFTAKGKLNLASAECRLPRSN